MVDVDRQRWDEEENIQDKPQPKHMKQKQKVTGRKGKEKILLKRHQILLPLFWLGFMYKLYLAHRLRGKNHCHNKNKNLVSPFGLEGASVCVAI